jgi:hypothetical protein
MPTTCSHSNRTRGSLASILFVVATACSDATGPVIDPEPPVGSFTAELSELVEGSLAGAASWSEPAGDRWMMTLVTPDGSARIGFAAPDGAGRPRAGVHSLVDHATADDGAAPGAYLMARVELPPDVVPGSAAFDFLVGTLTVTESTEDRVEGHFELATSVAGQPTQALVVLGAFESIRVEQADARAPFRTLIAPRFRGNVGRTPP